MALALDGEVTIATPGGTARLRGLPGGASVTLPSGHDGETALRHFFEAIGGRDGIRATDEGLRRLGLGLRLEHDGRVLAELGAGAQGGLMERAAGLGGADVRFGALLKLLTAR